MDAQTVGQILADEAQMAEAMAAEAAQDDRERLERPRKPRPRFGHAAHEGWPKAD